MTVEEEYPQLEPFFVVINNEEASHISKDVSDNSKLNGRRPSKSVFPEVLDEAPRTDAESANRVPRTPVGRRMER